MMFLILGLVALFGGFAALPVLRTRPQWRVALGGFVVASVGGLVLLHLIPHNFEAVGAPAILAAALGLVAPIVMERVASRRIQREGLFQIGVVAVLGGLLLHAFVDGAALALPELHGAAHGHTHESAHNDNLLALGVLLHRLPVGLGIGWALIPRWGMGRALGVVVGVGGATVLGFFLGIGALGSLSAEGLALFQSLVAGILLHVVFMHAPPRTGLTEKTTRLLGASGALAGLALVGSLELMAESEPFGLARGLAMAALAALTLAMFLRGGQIPILGALLGHRDHGDEPGETPPSPS